MANGHSPVAIFWSPSKGPGPVATLWHPERFPELSHFFYDLANPSASDMDTTVAYTGVAYLDRRNLAENTVGVALGLFNPQKARWLGALVYHAILPEPPLPNLEERPDPYMLPLRNELAAKFAKWALNEQVRHNVHKPNITAVAPSWTFGEVYARLGKGQEEAPWDVAQRRQLAAMLNEPDFNALLVARFLEDKLTDEFCLDDDPTTLSLDKFIDYLNSTPRDKRALFGRIHLQEFRDIKKEFVQRLLAWVNGKGNWDIFGKVDDAYKRFPAPTGHRVYPSDSA